MYEVAADFTGCFGSSRINNGSVIMSRSLFPGVVDQDLKKIGKIREFLSEIIIAVIISTRSSAW